MTTGFWLPSPGVEGKKENEEGTLATQASHMSNSFMDMISQITHRVWRESPDTQSMINPMTQSGVVTESKLERCKHYTVLTSLSRIMTILTQSHHQTQLATGSMCSPGSSFGT